VKSKQYWKVQKQKLQASGGLFDLDGLETDIAEFDDRMLDPEFWNNAEAAQEVINQSNQLKAVYNTFKSLEAQYEDLEVLYEMVKEDEDPEYLEELNEKTTEFTEALEKYELTMLLNGPHDKSNAILEIHPGAGGTESQDWGSMLFRMYTRWADKKGFDKRVQFYTSRDYSMQIEKGEDYPKLKPTYFVGILNFGIGTGKNYLGKHYNIEEETGKCVLGDIQHRFIQLTKFKKKHHELTTLVDKWTFFIKHAKNLAVIPENVSDEGLKMAYQEADKHLWKKEEIIAYENASMREQDERGERALAKEEGKEEGKEEKEREAILGFHEIGVSIDNIAKALKITAEKVREIIEISQHKK